MGRRVAVGREVVVEVVAGRATSRGGVGLPAAGVDMCMKMGMKRLVARLVTTTRPVTVTVGLPVRVTVPVAVLMAVRVATVALV